MKYFLLLNMLFDFLFAHPHVFMEIYPTIEVKNNKTTTIHFKWKMDEMTSSILIAQFDKDGDGKIDKEENTFIYKKDFVT